MPSIAIALTAALALRAARLDVRPMHHDEANQAIKFGDLLERGEYRYDFRDHHGPTLYYLTLPSAWLGGRHTLASLDEVTLRRVPVMFGAATILLLPLVSAGIGRTAVAAAAILMALSPAMVFYSRMFIQEALLSCFTLAFVIAAGRVAMGGGRAWWVLAGVAAGLAAATKETSAIVLPAAIAACAIAWWSLGSERPRSPLTDGGWRGPARREPRCRGSRRGAVLFILLLGAGRHARAFPRRRNIPGPRDRSRQPGASVGLLRPPARLHVVGGDDVERRSRYRAGRHWRSRGVAPAP